MKKEKLYSVYCGECDDTLFEGNKVECEQWMKNNEFGNPEEEDEGWVGYCIDCARTL